MGTGSRTAFSRGSGSLEAKEGQLVGAEVVVVDDKLEIVVSVEDSKHFIANPTIGSREILLPRCRIGRTRYHAVFCRCKPLH